MRREAGSSTWVAIVAVVLAAVPIGTRARQGADAPGWIAEAVERAYHPLLAEYDVPGMAVAVTVDGQRYFFSYGVASRESRQRVSEDTLFEVGSISKTVTATLACWAEATGALSLDDHPGRLMAAVRSTAIDRATLLHLGTYTAGGLPLQFPDEVTTAPGMEAYFREWQPAAAPGAGRRYSNPSIGLLGHVTALAMGGRFADLVESRLLPKLGLFRSYIRVPAAEMGRYAWGHDKANRQIRVTPGVFDAEAYGLKSTSADLIRYVEANIAGEGLGDPLRRAVACTHVGRFRVGPMVQGLGWEQYPYPVALDRLLAGNAAAMIESTPVVPLAASERPAGAVLFNKTGSTNGFGGYVAFVPARRMGIVMLANRNFPNAARVAAAHAVLERLSAGR